MTHFRSLLLPICSLLLGLGTTAPLAAQAPDTVAACENGMEGFAAESPRDRREILQALSSRGAAVPTDSLVPITDGAPAPLSSNASTVRRLLERNYPSTLRDLGASGEVRLLVRIDQSGAVTQVRIVRGAAHREFNEAAQRVVRGMRFRAAEHEGCPLPVWRLVPVSFSAG